MHTCVPEHGVHSSSSMPSNTTLLILGCIKSSLLFNLMSFKSKVKTDFLSEFSYRMMISGYSEKVRYDVIKNSLVAYDTQVERDQSGECPLYRPREYKKEERKRKKLRTKMAWYKPHDTVLFCPPSPNSILAKELQKIADKEKEDSGISIKVVERAGRKMQSLLPGIKDDMNCGREGCMVHAHGGKGKCDREGVVYMGTCITCEERVPRRKVVYIGETGRSGYARGKEHLQAIKHPESHQNQNAFAKHVVQVHKDEEEEVKVKLDIIKSFKKPLERQVREGIEILRVDADIRLNSKLDVIQPNMRRVVFEGILDEE